MVKLYVQNKGFKSLRKRASKGPENRLYDPHVTISTAIAPCREVKNNNLTGLL